MLVDEAKTRLERVLVSFVRTCSPPPLLVLCVFILLVTSTGPLARCQQPSMPYGCRSRSLRLRVIIIVTQLTPSYSCPVHHKETCKEPQHDDKPLDDPPASIDPGDAIARLLSYDLGTFIADPITSLGSAPRALRRGVRVQDEQCAAAAAAREPNSA